MSDRGDDSFLSRWSRRKAQVRQGLPAEPAPQQWPPAAAPVSAQTMVESAPPEPAAADAAVETPAPPPPTMADVEALTPASDFTRFVAPGVDAQVKNSAMKKLFSDPHYNVMDGLDVYIDDYNTPDPLPKSMLRQMVQSRLLGLFDEDPAEAKPAAAVAPASLQPATDDAAPAPAPDTALPAPTSETDEDPDLRLQPDDAAGRPGDGDAAPGAGQDPAGQP